MNLFAVINNKLDEKVILKCAPEGACITIFNLEFHKDKKKGWELLNEYGAKELPFLVINHNTQHPIPIYKEVYKDPIIELFKYN